MTALVAPAQGLRRNSLAQASEIVVHHLHCFNKHGAYQMQDRLVACWQFYASFTSIKLLVASAMMSALLLNLS